MDASERVSTSQISVAMLAEAINSRHRGWVSQTTFDSGKVSRNAATAGNVCTMSPSDPSLTTRNFDSRMRRFANTFNQLARRMIFGIADNRDTNAESFRSGTFRHVRRGV